MFQALDWSRFFDSGLIFSTKPGCVVLSWGKVQESKTPFKDSARWSFFCPDFYLNHSKYLQFEHNVECLCSELLIYLNQNLSGEGLSSPLCFSKLDFSLFQEQFAKIQIAIKNKKITKAVPVIFQKAEKVFSVLEKKHLLKSLLKKVNASVVKNQSTVESSLHLYGLFLQGQSILGASPEILFSYNLKQKHLKSMALAGTDLSTKKKGSLLASKKDSQEHEVVVQCLNSIFLKLKGKNLLTKNNTYEWDIGYLKHLRKDFQMKINAFNFPEIIKLFHPTPALGTFPKENWSFLKTLDTKEERLKYGAPFVALAPSGNVKAIVAIRNIQWSLKQVWLFTGCGVIVTSNIKKEFQELKNKVKSVKILLDL